MDNYRFILSGGGTGGHIYPAIAIANELKRRYPKAEFLFVGAKDRMEMEKVPQAGYNIQGLWISGLQRKFTFKNMLFPLKLISSLIKAGNIISKFKPHAVIGTGGFASGPLLYRAAGKNIPALIQEQNSYAGITNKLLAKKVEKICVAYTNMEQFFPKEKIVLTGNPVRQDLVTVNQNKIKEASSFFDLDENKMTLLILGGSLGAKRINKLIADKLIFFERLGIQVLWQCGKLYVDEYQKYSTDTIKVHAYLDRMDLAYTVADFIVSRAGASSVSELCLVGKPVIFIPSPNVAEDHQTKNGEALVKQDAALMIKEADIEQQFESVFSDLFLSKEKQERLGETIKQMAKPKATSTIVDEIEHLLKN